VYLHIGPPKTGTTYLQDALRSWHKELRATGVLFPGIPGHDHFAAALDLRGVDRFGRGDVRGQTRARVAGAWARLVRATTGFDGTVVISHEIFANANDEQVAAAMRDLADTDLHVVVTARDPGRQMVSTWQQHVKQGSSRPFRGGARAQPATALPPIQRLPDLLERWGSSLPADHLHLVTVPPPGGDPALLWTRFCSVVGIDPEQFSPPLPPANTSLGVAEIEVLRRVNAELGGRLTYPGYGRFVTSLYANGALAESSQSPPPTLPERLRPLADQIAASWIERIEPRGYHVCGDLDDLRPRHRQGVAPDAAADSDVAQAAVRATAQLLLDLSRQSRTRAIRRLGREAATDWLGYLARRVGRSGQDASQAD
jgi:hypothetical protein